MFKALRQVIAPILSLIMLVMGNALFVTYASIRLKLDGHNVDIIGYIVGLYFAGLLIGSYWGNKIIETIGHIRTYTLLASSMTVLAIIQSLCLKIWMWGLVRFLGGICIAGLFINIESWLIAKSDIHNKGKILSIYMIAFYASQGIGQLLLNVADPFSFVPFAIVVLLSAISIIPVSITKMAAPVIQQRSELNLLKLIRHSPVGVYTCAISGLLLGPIYGLIPIFAKDIGMTLQYVAYATTFTILGGFIFQWPIGQLSDKFDRKKIIFISAIGTALTTLTMTLIPYNSEFFIFLLLALFGGFAFIIYPLGISYSSDSINQKDIIAVTAILSLAYSVGAIIGPILASYSMTLLGPRGLFIYSFLVAVTLCCISILKIIPKKPLS